MKVETKEQWSLTMSFTLTIVLHTTGSREIIKKHIVRFRCVCVMVRAGIAEKGQGRRKRVSGVCHRAEMEKRKEKILSWVVSEGI